MEKENLNQTKEKMIKRCRVFGRILLSVKWVVIIATIMGIILLFSLGIEIGKNSFDVELPNEIMQENTINENVDESDFKMVTIVGSITGFLVVIGNFVLIDSMGKIFMNISKEGTPFTNNIIKAMKDICVFATIIWFFGLFSSVGGMGLVWLLIIWTMYYIFKYGYQLQIESDETL